MQIGTLEFELTRGRSKGKLVILGRPYGQETPVTLEDVERCAQYFTRFAASWRASTPPDFYRVLGVDRSATKEDLKKAYRTLAKAHHPDVQPGHEVKLKEINAAYEVLRDPERRRQYDEQCAR
jgi:DnaJ-domain-containing protein 1